MSRPVSHKPVQVPELAELAARIRAGEREAESALLRHYALGVRAVVRQNCRPGESQVDDIAQEILGSLLGRLRAGTILDVQALPHYLRTAIQHACVAFYRQHQKQTQAAGEIGLGHVAVDPAHAAHRQHLHQAIRELIADLPNRRDRELLRRFYLDGHERDHVCADLGIDSHHFHRVIHRARLRLRDAADRLGFGDLW